VAEDAFQGHAQFKVLVDGKQLGDVQTVTASHAAGQWQEVTLSGAIGSGAHKVEVAYLNDLYGGSAAADRNLYVDWISLNGSTSMSSAAATAAPTTTTATATAADAPVIATPEAKATPGGAHGYIAVGASGTATGTAGADDFYVTGAHQTLIGNGGNDLFHVGSYSATKIVVGGTGITAVSAWGDFTLGDGVDNLSAAGNYAHRLIGNAKANFITGSNGNDVIDGGAGHDTIVVGTGANKLTGGSGQDLFVFGKAADHDNVITDFHVGEDMLDLRGAVKDAGYTGTNALADHVLSVTQVGADAVIGIDADGTGPGAGHVLATLQQTQANLLKAGVDYLWH
jgi:Ca2+-binding RTX toxin-like protein